MRNGANSDDAYALKVVQASASNLLVRPFAKPDEHVWGYRLRLANSNGLTNPAWLDIAWPEGVSKGLERARWCPLCLDNEGAYWLQGWSRSPAVCRIHQCWLVDRCGKCARPATWRRVRMFACRCEHPLAENPVEYPGEDVRTLLIASQTNDPTPSGWKALSVERRWEVARFLGALSIYGLHAKPLKKASAAIVETERQLVTCGAGLLHGGETEFHWLLDRLRRFPSKGGTVQLLSEAFSGLLLKMRRQLARNEYDHFFSYIDSYLLTKADSKAVILYRGAKEAEAGSAKHCARNLNVRPENIPRLLLQHGITPKVRFAPSGRKMLVIGPSDLRQAQRSISATTTKKAVARSFGISVPRQNELIKAGLIRAMGAKANGQSVISLFQRIASAARKVPASDCGDFLPLNEALRTLVPIPMTLALFGAMLNGAIPVLISKEELGCLGIEISRRHVRPIMEKAREACTDFLTIPEAAAVLGLKQEVTYHLVNRKLISATYRRVGRRKARFITRSEIERFTGAVESLAKAAERIGIAKQGALQWAQARGIKIVSGPAVDGGRQYFVERCPTGS